MASLPLPAARERPQLAAARAIHGRFRSGQPVERAVLRAVFEDVTGGSDASGAWSMRDALDGVRKGR